MSAEAEQKPTNNGPDLDGRGDGFGKRDFAIASGVILGLMCQLGVHIPPGVWSTVGLPTISSAPAHAHGIRSKLLDSNDSPVSFQAAGSELLRISPRADGSHDIAARDGYVGVIDTAGRFWPAASDDMAMTGDRR